MSLFENLSTRELAVTIVLNFFLDLRKKVKQIMSEM